MIPRLVAITPGRGGDGHELIWQVQAMVAAGLRALILREPALEERPYVTLARALSHELGPGLILHASNPHALRLAERGAFGLHCPGGSDWVEARRRVRGLLGASCHDRDELLAARAAGCDYALLGPVYTPGSKPEDTRPTLGPDGLAQAISGLGLPVLALGGMTPERAAAAVAAGAAGVAGIGGLFRPSGLPEDAAQAVRAFLLALG